MNPEEIDGYWKKDDNEIAKIENIKSLIDEVESLSGSRTITGGEYELNRILFRGVSKSEYRLRSSLGRLRWKDSKERTESSSDWVRPDNGSVDIGYIERHATKEFVHRVQRHDIERLRWLNQNQSDLNTWQLMQHHGAPTRLLDWTASPYVAAYFACEKEPDSDGVVWMVDHGAIMDRTRNRLQSNSNIPLFVGELSKISEESAGMYAPCIMFFRCGLASSQVLSQQSWFSCTWISSVDHDWAISQLLRSQEKEPGIWKGRWTRKLIIPKDAKPVLLRSLWQMNITGESLFPGLDGLGRTISSMPQLLKSDKNVSFRWEEGLLSQHGVNDAQRPQL